MGELTDRRERYHPRLIRHPDIDDRALRLFVVIVLDVPSHGVDAYGPFNRSEAEAAALSMCDDLDAGGETLAEALVAIVPLNSPG